MAQTTTDNPVRGEETRRRLLQAGIELFGEYGFDPVSTRQLARAAGVNQAAISYHFGGKRGVYLAVAEDLVDSLGRQARRLREGIEQELGQGDDEPRRAGELLRRLLHGMAELMLNDRLGTHLFLFVMREQMEPTEAFEIIYTGYMQPVHATISRLVARCLGRGEQDREVIIRAHALIGQVIGFRAARAAALRRLDLPAYGPGDVEAIAAIIAGQAVDALLYAGSLSGDGHD